MESEFGGRVFEKESTILQTLNDFFSFVVLQVFFGGICEAA